MPEGMSEQEAIDALMGAAAEDGYETSTAAAERSFAEATGQNAPPHEQAEEAPPEESAGEGTTSEEDDSFLRHLDPSTLPEELIPYYKSMQGDMTRKAQELAEQRRQYEALEEFGGVETATQALEWISSLSEPENALALHRELTAVLQEQGLTPEQASAEAARQVDAAIDDEDDFVSDIGGTDPRFDQLQSELNEMKGLLAQREEQEFLNRVAANMDRQEAEVRQAHPDWDDDDIEVVYNMAYSTGANLEAAADMYSNAESHILGRWIEKKSSPAQSVDAVPLGGSADQVPETPTDLYDKGLEERVNRYIAERLAAEQ